MKGLKTIAEEIRELIRTVWGLEKDLKNELSQGVSCLSNELM